MAIAALPRGRETELKGGSIGKPDSMLGAYDRSINPGLRFPFERIPPCHLPPGAATRNLKRLSISYVVTRSRPYLDTQHSIL